MSDATPYDDLPSEKQGERRLQWAERMEELRLQVDLTAEFAASGKPYVELGEDGQPTWVHPGRALGGEHRAAEDDDPPEPLPFIVRAMVGDGWSAREVEAWMHRPSVWAAGRSPLEAALEGRADLVWRAWNGLTQEFAPSEVATRASEVIEGRLAALRESLVADGVWTINELRRKWQVDASEAEVRLRRAAAEHRVFTVVDDGVELVPAILLDGDLQPRQDLQEIIETLQGVGESGWALWNWLARPTAWLAGAVPAELVRTDPAKVLTAARSRAGNASG